MQPSTDRSPSHFAAPAQPSNYHSPRHLGVPQHGREHTSANSDFTFQNFLSHRTSSTPEYLTSKPKWGHTSFRGALFSKPDHASELNLHKEQYGESETKGMQRKEATRAASAASAYSRKHASSSSSFSFSSNENKKQPNNNSKRHQYHALDSPTLNVNTHGVDYNSANVNFHFQNYLAHRNSPKLIGKNKPLWGHATFRGSLFSRPDHSSEIHLHPQMYHEKKREVKRMNQRELDLHKKSTPEYVQQRIDQDIANSRAQYRRRQGSSSSSHQLKEAKVISVNRKGASNNSREQENMNANDEELDEYERLATSGYAPAPSEVKEQLSREQRRLNDLTKWAKDAKVYEQMKVVDVKNDVEQKINFCQVLLDGRDPHALKLLNQVMAGNTMYSDTIIEAKDILASVITEAVKVAVATSGDSSSSSSSSGTGGDNNGSNSGSNYNNIINNNSDNASNSITKPVSPKRPNDKLKRSERRKQAWGRKDDRIDDDDDDEDEDLEMMVDSVLSQSSSIYNNNNNNNSPMITSDLTLETVLNAFSGYNDEACVDRSSSVAGTAGGSVKMESVNGGEEEDEARYTDEWEMDSQETLQEVEDDDTGSFESSIWTGNGTTHQTYQDNGNSAPMHEYNGSQQEQDNNNNNNNNNRKAGFNNVLYHGNTDKSETFVSPSKESIRRHPHQQKVKDRLGKPDSSRSAAWLTKRVQVASNGAIWVGKNFRPEPGATSTVVKSTKKTVQWPSSRPGVSSRSSITVKNRRGKRKTNKHVVFKKKHGRDISSGNVRACFNVF
jgi:hypothetical protein